MLQVHAPVKIVFIFTALFSLQQKHIAIVMIKRHLQLQNKMLA